MLHSCSTLNSSPPCSLGILFININYSELWQDIIAVRLSLTEFTIRGMYSFFNFTYLSSTSGSIGNRKIYLKKKKKNLSKAAFLPLRDIYNLWEDLGEWHWSMYNIMYETSRQSRFDVRYGLLGAGALGRPRGWVWGGRREEGSGWGTHVYLWQIHFDIWQN